MTPLTVVTHDPCYGGGGLAQLEVFLAAARALGREPEVLYVPHPTLRPELRLPTTHRVEALRLLLGSRTLARRIRTAANDVWVVTTQAQHGLAARLAGARYACWIGTSVAAENPARLRGLSRSRRFALHVNEPPLRLYERAVLRGAAAVYATSPSSREDVAAAARVDEQHVGILPIPVDLDRFVPVPDDEWRASLARPTLVFVGRADDPRKHVRLLLDAFAQLRRTRPDARLRLVGTAPRAAAPPGVELRGTVDDLAGELASASLLVLPSRQEGFGIVVAEAFACGVPAVVTPSGGPEHLVRASGGGVVLRRHDARELAAAVDELIGDPGRLTAMRRAARTYVEREHAPAVLRRRLQEAIEELDGRP